MSFNSLFSHPDLFRQQVSTEAMLELAWIRLNKPDNTLSLAWYSRAMGNRSTGMTTIECRPRYAAVWTPVFVPRPVSKFPGYEYWETIVDLDALDLTMPMEIRLRYDFWKDDRAAHYVADNQGRGYVLGVSSPVMRHKVPAAILPHKVCLLQARAGDFLQADTLLYREGVLQITAMTDCWPSTIFARGQWADREGRVKEFLFDLAPANKEDRYSFPRVCTGEITLAETANDDDNLDWAEFSLYVVSADGDTISEHPGPFGRPWKCFAGPPGFSTIY